MPSAMTGQEDNLNTIQAADPERIRRSAERSFDNDLLDVLKTINRVEATSTDDPDTCLLKLTLEIDRRHGLVRGSHHPASA